MSEKIGDMAGKLWTYLKEKGPAPASRMQKELGASASLTHQGIGWLAREGKLEIDRSQKKEPNYKLRE